MPRNGNCRTCRTASELSSNENDASDIKRVNLSSTKKRTKTQRVSKESIRQFWTDECDHYSFITGKEDTTIGNVTNNIERSATFTIRGKPLPLIRHRSARGFMYNPSAAAQEEFRDSLLSIMPQQHHPIIVDDGISDDAPITFFSENEFLEVSILFRFKRPKSHFVNNKAGEGRIKANAPGRFHATRTDIDNLAKFVLDSLNGVLFADDRQVVSLKAMKILDSEGMCEGATDVSITVLNDE